jgi:predicted ATPase/DNA-binding winged helix-turn-helix (wHTH) protein
LPAPPLHFGPGKRFELRQDERVLLVDGEPAALGARAFDLLLALAEHAGEVQTKHVLMDRIWPGLVVEENNLSVQMSALRKVLGPTPIATIPGRGYRFNAAPESSPAARSRPVQSPIEADALRTNLPQQLPMLLGRDDDLAALTARLQAHRLVTLVGPGGIGKSRLAQAVLHAQNQTQQRAHRHGVCWVELATVTDAAALPGAIADALDLRLPGAGPFAGLGTVMAPLQLLLALDNAEHLLAEVAQLAQSLLNAAPGLRLLVTSQAPLRLVDEQVHRLDGLEVPLSPLSAADAMAYGAIKLFVERARAADGRFVLTDAQVPTLVDICRALDGGPLALELAAARVPLLGVAKLAATLPDRLRLLTVNRNREAPPRQQTLRATLAWSHGFLNEAEAAVFRRMAVWVGSAGLRLLQQVVADPADEGPLDEWAMLDALGSLVDRSLVSVVDVEGATEPRYRLLDSTRLFALECLQQAGELDALRLRHAHAVATLFDTAHHDFHRQHWLMGGWSRLLSLDLDNARQAIYTALAVDDMVTLFRILPTMLIVMPGTLRDEITALCKRCMPMLDRLGPAQWSLAARASLHMALRQSERASPSALPLSQAIWRQAADAPPGLVDDLDRYLIASGVALVAARRYDIALAELALQQARALEQPGWPPQTLMHRLEVERRLAKVSGDTARWLSTCQRLVTLQVASGRANGVARHNLIEAELATGHAQAAADAGMALIAAHLNARDESHLVYARLNTSAAWLALDNTAQARQLLLPGWQQCGAHQLQACFADYLALMAALEDRPRAAALLVGYADAGNMPGTREPNEASAVARARARAGAALGDRALSSLGAQGSQLSEDEVTAIAFAKTDLA